MDGYDKSNEDSVVKCTKKAPEQLFAYVYLENADQSKYGSILKGLNKQKSLGNKKCPKTITETNNVLSNHCFNSGRSWQGNN
eukprot:3218619-Ditylum_brightwellii.AAC.1